MMFLPRSFRIACFCIVYPLQIGIILSANYTFLNYLVLVLGFLLLDDRLLKKLVPKRWEISGGVTIPDAANAKAEENPAGLCPALQDMPVSEVPPRKESLVKEARQSTTAARQKGWRETVEKQGAAVKLAVTAVLLTCIFYATAVQMVWMVKPVELPTTPVSALEPFRIANRYGLFAVMTRGRYEIEFQGSNDGNTWTPYPFRYKPQDPRAAPGVYAPYQPRFDWNLWFASLDNWQQNRFVIYAEEKLLTGSPSVLALFAGNPFPDAPPVQLRAVVWQYWFSDRAEKQQGFWWRRELIGLYAPALDRQP